MLKKILATSVIGASLLTSNAIASNQIRVVGSSTVYPFITVAAEEFGSTTSYKTPIIESTGTGGGFKLFCSKESPNSPDLSNASRAIKTSEIEKCKSNNITDITEIKLGYDGIVLANAAGQEVFNLTTYQIFQALGREVPVNGKLVKNPYKKWSEIDSNLPDIKIEVYGPPPTSGTRDAFVELSLEKACKDLPEFKAKYSDKKAIKKACHLIREDGNFIEMGENDNLIVQKLKSNPGALGIFGFSFLDQNRNLIQSSLINGHPANFDNILEGKYPISRPLYVYLKNSSLKTTEGLKDFILELTSENAIGEDGYLIDKGLIPIAESEFEELEDTIQRAIN